MTDAEFHSLLAAMPYRSDAEWRTLNQIERGLLDIWRANTRKPTARAKTQLAAMAERAGVVS